MATGRHGHIPGTVKAYATLEQDGPLLWLDLLSNISGCYSMDNIFGTRSRRHDSHHTTHNECTCHLLFNHTQHTTNYVHLIIHSTPQSMYSIRHSIVP
ncbi:hypothetical protein IJGMMPBP_00065 [Infectious spleen and kidney necrosis virus]|uniref:Uncharacterized protein n=1 Tax=Infectious spleen and kidney necrosis virus TaxID=180170 RepID=A0A7U1BJC3_ISKNV|nr:hypothetical protein IJGMMPBP_00065 [Infectious spleen and kidney necrosis virus]QQZ00613.1 hypothetical protein NIDBEMMG_00038 [Infectious spleen and kidney necrosis virus]WHE27054.1 hypothetical protein [Infectious spleen and kidney necrosis virus]WNH14632.1 hypothetical protein [Infectious spleen and kidney necrosis virus]